MARRELAPTTDMTPLYDHSTIYEHDDVLPHNPSIYARPPENEDAKREANVPSAPPPQPQGQPPVQPSIRLLFSLLSAKHRVMLLFPAVVSSIIAGGIAPFMTFVVGQAFEAFSRFPLTPSPPPSAARTLLRDVGISALQLIGLAVGSLALGSVTSSLWIWTGELNTMALKRKVYNAVTRKEMAWFDSHMGTADDPNKETSSVGAGGLLAKFTRETEEVRTASSLASGLLLQHLTTVFACLLLALTRSYQLTLIILASVPLLMFIQGFAQGIAAPLLAHERHETGAAASVVERAVSLISTVKAFNAERFEFHKAGSLFTTLRLAARRLNTVWACTSATAQFVMMGMFVQGFWFGGKLVRDGKASPGEVMAVFWACLIATSNLQLCVPQFIALAKGKQALVGLLELVGKEKPLPPTPLPLASTMHRFKHSLDKSSPPSTFSPRSMAISSPSPLIKPSSLRKNFQPPPPLSGSSSNGSTPGIVLHNITLAYPSRLSVPALSRVSLHLSGGKTTFIVGSSGSGKSSIAALLMGWYAPQRGDIKIGGQEINTSSQSYREWVEREICCVGQAGGAGTVILEGKTVVENVAAAAAFMPNTLHDHRFPPSDSHRYNHISRKQVKDACQASLMHEFVRELPEGYDTTLSSGSGGEKGITLSGGQKQRLALARAWIRDPPILILDEATSALDPTSRLLVFEALKLWRNGKTTVVITHDLAQIQTGDFVYVLKEGRIVERGYRRDLERPSGKQRDAAASGKDSGKGEFRRMLDAQEEMGGWLPEKDIQSKESLVDDWSPTTEEPDEGVPQNLKHQSIAVRPLTWGNLLSKSRSSISVRPPRQQLSFGGSGNALRSFALLTKRSNRRLRSWDKDRNTQEPERHHRRHSTTHFSPPSGTIPLPPDPAFTSTTTRRLSLPTTSPATSPQIHPQKPKWIEDEEMSQQLLTQTGLWAKEGRERRAGVERVRRSEDAPHDTLSFDEPAKPSPTQPTSLLALARVIYPTIPYKPLLFVGLLTCAVSGAITPFFSFLLSRLLFEVSTGARDPRNINIFGGIVLSIAAFDGIFLGVKYWVMETCAMFWVTRMRRLSFTRLLLQDRAWFDVADHATPRIIQLLIKDADDARDLISVVLAQFVVVSTMLGVGLTWAMITGWQLTLAGIAVVPVFGLVMMVQAHWVNKSERRGRKAREYVARAYYDVLINIRSIRCMSLQPFFDLQFETATDQALIIGVQGAFVEGCTYGVATGLIYLAEAVIFYVAAVLLANGTYSYMQMIEVLNLVIFTVTIGSQLMAFTEKITKSAQATSDFNQLMTLSTLTEESRGSMRPLLSGSITFHHVRFSYPERPDVPVLKDISFAILSGECVAIVGSSGCGKSTVAALLQRLYEPSDGSIGIGPYDLSSVDVHHLRAHISVVSQHPHLFDASIKDNIRYGNPNISDADVQRAAEAANLHGFICQLPQGYNTFVGEGASLLSGGQAQRLQLARAFARQSKILILDECTSALDPTNESMVLDTIMRFKQDEGRTVIMITHKVSLMRVCDRILVLKGGKVAEDGRYNDLTERPNGVFERLANAGEWSW